MKPINLFLRAFFVVMLTFFVSSLSFALECIPPSAGMVSWWAAEGNAKDVKNLNNGILKNGASFAQGKVGQAFSLNDKTNAFVLIPNSPSLNVGTGNFSMEAWVKSNGTKGVASIIDKRGNEYVGYAWFLGSGYLAAQLDAPGLAGTNFGGTSIFISDGKFHHLAVTIQRSVKNGGKLFVDGMLDANFNPTLYQGNLDNTANFLIGGHLFDSNLTFNGLIDELSLYNRELSEAEITAIFNAGSAGKCQRTIYDITSQPNIGLDFATNYDAKNAQTVELKNTSATPITVSNVVISDAGNYWVNLFTDSKSACRAKHYTANLKNFLIPAKSSCNISIGFSPFDNLTAGKAIPATLTLKTMINGIAADKVINLTGIGRVQMANFYNNNPKLWGQATWGVSELKAGNAPINTTLVGATTGYGSAKFWYGSVTNPVLQKPTASVSNLVVFAQNSTNATGHVGVVIQTTPVVTMLSMNDIGAGVHKWSVRPVDWYPNATATWSPLITGFNATDATKHYGFISWKNAVY